jgi:photosystem II stability/assembly factor-like uncharacterized protein
MRRFANRRGAALGVAAVGATLLLAACDTGDFTIRYTVGSGGLILKTTDAGVTWTPQPSGTTRNLFAVSFDGTSTHGCIVGAGGRILFTTDGTTWTRASVVPTSNDLNGVDTTPIPTDSGLVDQDYAVGERGTILTSSDCNTWTLQVSGTSRNLNAVSTCRCGSGDAWAVGDKGTILVTTDGGATWTPQVSGTTATLEGVSFSDSYDGWAVGKGGIILATTDGGTTWTQQVSGTTSSLDSVAFVADAQHGYAVGAEGLILFTADGGTTWVKQISNTSRDLESVSTIFGFNSGDATTRVSGSENPNDWHDAIAVGKKGTIVTTEDGGLTWTKQNSGTSRALAGVA